ncbi:MAG: hypothetical protein HZB59_09940 [Ignavibacteriales bacterium]|nr:hypothetical protein [Ignavibacteriales bacterium]
MVSSFKYRSVAILLAGIFSVFNIGLPIALHYCKMMETVSSNSCEMCTTHKKESKDIQISKPESSCCKTILGVDRNQTEFLQTQNDVVTQTQNYSTTAIIYDSNIFESTTFSKSIFNDTHSPPLTEDIPIFISSLLI